MRKRATILLTVGCAIAMVAYLGQALGRPGSPEQLANGEPSEAELIDRLLGALERKDVDALRRLRVTELEYTQILMRGDVPEGQPLKPPPSKALADLAWGLVDTKSRYYEQNLLAEFGGRTLRRKAVTYEEGEERFANHTVRKQLRLMLEDPAAGKDVLLATGSVVEVAGRYKFASFVRD